MGYVYKTLGSKEQILYSTGYHWFFWLYVAMMAGPFFVIALITLPYGVWDYLLLTITAIPMLYGVGSFVHGIALEVAVTSDRFVKKSGLVSITTEEVSLDKIEEVNVDESILGRIFGYGTIHVHGTGAGDIQVHLIADPINLRRQIQTAREQIKSRGE